MTAWSSPATSAAASGRDSSPRGTISSGHSAARIIRADTLPTRALARGPWAREPRTSRSTPSFDSASSTSVGRPSRTRVSDRRPAGKPAHSRSIDEPSSSALSTTSLNVDVERRRRVSDRDQPQRGSSGERDIRRHRPRPVLVAARRRQPRSSPGCPHTPQNLGVRRQPDREGCGRASSTRRRQGCGRPSRRGPIR